MVPFFFSIDLHTLGLPSPLSLKYPDIFALKKHSFIDQLTGALAMHQFRDTSCNKYNFSFRKHLNIYKPRNLSEKG